MIAMFKVEYQPLGQLSILGPALVVVFKGHVERLAEVCEVFSRDVLAQYVGKSGYVFWSHRFLRLGRLIPVRLQTDCLKRNT